MFNATTFSTTAFDATPFAEAHKATVDTLARLADQASKSTERLAALNLQAVKTTLAEAAEGAQAALAAKNPVELLKLQAAVLQAAPQKALAYGRHLKDIFTSATAEQRAAAEAQVADVQAKFLEAVDGALKNAPGSENAIALVKSAVVAANNAYEGVNKASLQVTEAVEANLAKVSETVATASSTALAKIEA